MDDVESQDDGHSCFLFCLPVIWGDATPRRAKDQPRAIRTMTSFRPYGRHHRHGGFSTVCMTTRLPAQMRQAITSSRQSIGALEDTVGRKRSPEGPSGLISRGPPL